MSQVVERFQCVFPPMYRTGAGISYTLRVLRRRALLTVGSSVICFLLFQLVLLVTPTTFSTVSDWFVLVKRCSLTFGSAFVVWVVVKRYREGPMSEDAESLPGLAKEFSERDFEGLAKAFAGLLVFTSVGRPSTVEASAPARQTHPEDDIIERISMVLKQVVRENRGSATVLKLAQCEVLIPFDNDDKLEEFCLSCAAATVAFFRKAQCRLIFMLDGVRGISSEQSARCRNLSIRLLELVNRMNEKDAVAKARRLLLNHDDRAMVLPALLVFHLIRDVTSLRTPEARSTDDFEQFLWAVVDWLNDFGVGISDPDDSDAPDQIYTPRFKE